MAATEAMFTALEQGTTRRRPSIYIAWAVLLLARGASAEEAKPAAMFAPAGMGVSVDLPGKPEDHSGWVKSPTGKMYLWVYQTTDAARRQSITLTVGRLAAVPEGDDAKNVFKNALEGIAAAVLGTVRDDRDAPLGEFPGRAWSVALPSGAFVHGRMALADRRFYQLIVESPREKLTPAEQQLVDSLRITPGVNIVEPPRALDWRWVTPEGEQYAVRLPDDPQEETSRRKTSLGDVEARRMVWESSDGKRSYAVVALRLPRTPTEDEAESLMTEARERLSKIEGAEPQDEADVQIGGKPGKRWSYQAGERARHVRVVVAGDRLYELSAVAGAKASEEDTQFLESLKLPQ
ncbi:MAG: hypothetical protein C0483_02070 [Pirellula sp.]|nr:hypothetical protein [Pirellula sp.]